MSSLYRILRAPVNHIEIFRQETNPPAIPSSPTYEINAPLGLVLSFFTAPLYLYATLHGKFQVWEKVLRDMAKDFDFIDPCFDCGCGR